MQCKLGHDSVCVFDGLSSLHLEGPGTHTKSKVKTSSKIGRNGKLVYRH